jgi:hypothetical protein
MSKVPFSQHHSVSGNQKLDLAYTPKHGGLLVWIAADHKAFYYLCVFLLVLMDFKICLLRLRVATGEGARTRQDGGRCLWSILIYESMVMGTSGRPEARRPGESERSGWATYGYVAEPPASRAAGEPWFSRYGVVG